MGTPYDVQVSWLSTLSCPYSVYSALHGLMCVVPWYGSTFPWNAWVILALVWALRGRCLREVRGVHI